MILLSLKKTCFVAHERDLDKPLDSGNELEVTGPVWMNALALAQTTGKFSPPNRHLNAGQTASLSAALKSANIEQESPPVLGLRASARFNATEQLRAFFRISAHRRELKRIIALLDRGGPLDVTNY